MPDSIDDHVSHFMATQAWASSSKAARVVYITAFLNWLQDNGVSADSASSGDVARWLQLQRAKYSPGTVNNVMYYSLKSYFRWLVETGSIQVNPIAELPRIPVARAAPRHVPIEDLRRLLDSTLDDRGWIVVALLAFQSLKISELVDLNVQDFDLKNAPFSMHFRPQAGLDRPNRLHVPNQLRERLLTYIDGRTHGPLLAIDGRRASRGAATGYVETSSRRAKLGYHVSPQMLAYSLQVIAAQEGFSLGSVIRTLGFPQRRHAERWLRGTSSLDSDSAASRLAALVLEDPLSASRLLDDLDALASQRRLPAGMLCASAGAVLERQLFNVCLKHGLRQPSDRRKEGRIVGYSNDLYRAGVIELGLKNRIEALIEDRNNGAHGAFELVTGSPHMFIGAVRDLVTMLETVQSTDG